VPPKFHLSLLIHAHQPVGNFEDVIENCYQNAYAPFVRMLEKHPAIRVGLHYSGSLLTWIERNHPEYFAQLRALAQRGQVEMIGGGFYEPILPVIPIEDQVEQVTRLASYLEKHFGKRPCGAWLAERVWEPQMPSALAAAEVSYSLVDDYHFLSAGFEPNELFGAYVAEDRGKTVRLFPGLKALRYLLPFGRVEDVIQFLRESAAIHPEGVAAMGDDMEKFGVWPGTFKHCYEDRWLENFFEALEANLDWLSLTPPGEYTESHTPLGRADLPTASYAEMTEWAFPTAVRRRYNAVQQEFSGRPEVAGFLRGGSWRGFFRKYAEANLLHKKMLRTATRVAAMPVRKIASKQTQELAEARDLLMRGQCNDAYWHGVFGGLYAPHLRTALWKNLIRAEWMADRQVPGGLPSRVEMLDYDADGANELLFTSPECQVLLKPSDGATLPLVDFRPAATALVNSMQRRPEAYHARLADATNSVSGVVASIHEQTRVKEQGLEKYLRYDRWARNAFRALIFSPKRTHEEYESLQLQEDAGFASGEYAVKSSGPQEAEIVREAMLPTKDGDVPFSLTKRFSLGPAPNGCEVACEIGIKLKEPLERAVMIGIESVINLLAPNDADRFFETADGPRPLRMSGILPGPILRMEDEWQRVRITLHAPGTQDYWIAPIETVSESEGGFERVYQGSQILARWKMSTEKVFSAQMVWRIESF